MSDLHEEGRFRAKAVEGAWGHTSNGVVQVAVMFELETGAKLTWYGYMTERAEERTMNSLIACGVTDLESLEGVDTNDVEVTIEHDTSPRTVEIPGDLDDALTGAGVRERFDALAYSARKEHVRSVQDAKQAETRQRRVTKIIEKLGR
jgi:hypothetical protein